MQRRPIKSLVDTASAAISSPCLTTDGRHVALQLHPNFDDLQNFLPALKLELDAAKRSSRKIIGQAFHSRGRPNPFRSHRIASNPAIVWRAVRGNLCRSHRGLVLQNLAERGKYIQAAICLARLTVPSRDFVCNVSCDISADALWHVHGTRVWKV
jgi:hypothetical protein